MTDPRVRDHEAAHTAAAAVLGLEVEPAEFDRMGWDGWLGRVRLTPAARAGLVGSLEDRFKIAVVAITPSVVILGEEEGSDAALVARVCPPDWSTAMWEFYVRRRAQKLVGEEEFRQGFAMATAEIEEPAAIKETGTPLPRSRAGVRRLKSRRSHQKNDVDESPSRRN